MTGEGSGEWMVALGGNTVEVRSCPFATETQWGEGFLDYPTFSHTVSLRHYFLLRLVRQFEWRFRRVQATARKRSAYRAE